MNISEDVISRQFDVDDFDEFLDDLVVEIELRNYRVTRIYDIDNVLEQEERGLSETVTFTRYKIVEFCNLNSCAQMMSADPSAGVFMPVKFIAYQKKTDASVHAAFLRPTRFAALFTSAGVMEIADGLEKDMQDVLDELDY